MSRRRSNGDGVKYKIIDIDNLEIDVGNLLEKYFFNSEYHTSCSVVLPNFDTNNIEKSSIVVDNDPSTFSTYKYTIEDIDNFFASNRGQKEKHTLEESICRPLIEQHIYKPYFYYCKLDPKIENIKLKSIEDHIRLKDPETHKEKLLEFLERGKRKKESNLHCHCRQRIDNL